MNYMHIDSALYPLNPGQVKARHPDTLFPEPFEPCDGYALVQTGTLPSHDPLTHRAVEIAPVADGPGWRQAFELVPLTIQEIAEAQATERKRLTEAVTAMRWARETGGITFPDGTRIGTSIDDQNRITAVIANAQLAGVTSVDFKAASGWVSLSLDEVCGIAAVIAVHVQDCFSAERAHHEAIEALESLEQLRTYDINAGWPA